MTNDGTWLPVGDAAKAAGVSEKALRRRIERGTVASEVRDGRRLVRVESVHDDPAPRNRGVDIAPLLARLEQLATDNGRLRALTEVATSTEERLKAKLVEQRERERIKLLPGRLLLPPSDSALRRSRTHARRSRVHARHIGRHARRSPVHARRSRTRHRRRKRPSPGAHRDALLADGRAVAAVVLAKLAAR